MCDPVWQVTLRSCVMEFLHKRLTVPLLFLPLLELELKNGLSAVQLDSFFELDTNTRTRGHSLKLKKKSFHTELRQHFFSERIINLWTAEQFG